MPLPAGTGMSRRSFLLRSAGRRAGRLRRGRALAPPPRSRDRPGGGRGAAPTAGGGVDLHGRRLGCVVGAGAGEGSRLPPAAPPAGQAGRRRGAVHRGRDPDVAPAGRRAGATPRRRQGGGVPGDRLRPPDESHFTSRHYWEVGELNTEARTGWMGRYLDVAGQPDNPLQGLSLDYSLAPALATARVPVAAVSTPSDYGFWAYGLEEPLTGPTLETFGQARHAGRGLDVPGPGPHRVAGHRHHPPAGGPVRRRGRQTARSPRPSPTRRAGTSSRSAWRCWRTCWPTNRCR